MLINQVDDIVCEDVYAAVKARTSRCWADKHHHALSERIYKMPGGDCGLMIHHKKVPRSQERAVRIKKKFITLYWAVGHHACNRWTSRFHERT